MTVSQYHSLLKISNVLFIPCSASVMMIQDKKQYPFPRTDTS